MLLKDIFGKPREGVHKYRIANIAIVDVIATLVAAYLLSLYFHNLFGLHPFQKTYLIVLVLLFLLGIVLHRIIGVDTTIDRWIRQFII